jgi:hypothetical protein
VLSIAYCFSGLQNSRLDRNRLTTEKEKNKMASNPNKTDVFQFMSVRSPKSLEKAKLRHFYIQDDYISQDVQLIPSKKLRKIFSSNNSESEIGKTLYNKVFCAEFESENIKAKNDEIVQLILATLNPPNTILCVPLLY